MEESQKESHLIFFFKKCIAKQTQLEDSIVRRKKKKSDLKSEKLAKPNIYLWILSVH